MGRSSRAGILAIVGLLTGVFSVLLAPAAAPASDRRPSSDTRPTVFTPQFIGMNLLSSTRHWPTVPIGAIRPTGTTWGTIEPAKGQYDWRGLDTWVAQAQAHGVELNYPFMNTPQWSSTRPTEHCNRGNVGCAAPPNPADWEDFVTALVTRYRGKISSYELWNEPNAVGFWSGTPAQMVDLASRAYRIIKTIDPHAIVLSPASASPGWPLPDYVWLDHYLQAGGVKYMDGIAWHGYSGIGKAPPFPPEELIEQINATRNVAAKYGLSNLPLWNTEGGWGADAIFSDDKQQVAYLMRWYLVQFTHGVARTYWYQWDNAIYGTLWREQGGVAPAGTAIKVVKDWLDGVTASTPCAVTSGAIWTCDLMKGDQRFRAVWSISNNAPYSTNATYSNSKTSGFSAYTDSSGAKSQITAQSVPVGPIPILLQAH